MTEAAIAPRAHASDKTAIVLALLIIALLTAHMSQDVVYGFESGDIEDLTAAAIAGVWLYGALAMAGRRTGYLLLLLGAFLSPVVSLAHMSGDGARDDLPASGDGLLFVWTMVALGVTAPVSLLFSIQGLWRLRRSVLDFILWTALPLALGATLLGYIIIKLN